MDPYAAQTYPPPPSSSQIQPQDPYLYNQQQQPQYDQQQPSQHYPYYPQIPPQQPQYPTPNPNPNPYPPQHHPEQEPVPIHPPGVPVQSDPTHMAAYQHGYYQSDPYYPQQQQLGYSDPGLVHPGGGQQQWQQQQGQAADYGLSSLYPPNGQPQNSGSGRGGGRGFRGGGSSFRGRGRGRGRGGKTTTGPPKPACMAWCELCRVDCNTLEILENHRNGKKHKKNLKVQEDLQKLAAAKTQETQVAAVAAAAAPEGPENPGLTKVESQAVERREKVGGGGSKRKMRDGERKSAEPSKKPKEIIPFICELCDVKCESAPTFDSHLKGKKHAFNLQRFQEQQASLGQAALQALYPALEALYPALLQALANQTNANASTSAANGGGLDQQVLQWLQAYLPQTGPAVLPQGPESAPVPALEPQGPNQTVEGVDQVEPAVKTEDQVEPPAVKSDEKVEGVVVKNEEKVEDVETKVEEKVEGENKGAETKQ